MRAPELSSRVSVGSRNFPTVIDLFIGLHCGSEPKTRRVSLVMGAFLGGMTLTRLLWESRSAGSSAGRHLRSEDVLVRPGAAESKDLAEQRGSGTAPTSEAADVRLGDNLCSMVPASPRVLVQKDTI